eukprot:PhM_4_TR16165/c6_g1_i1/m.24610
MTNFISRYWHFLYTSNVLPSDTFEQRMRKLVLGAAGVVAPYMLIDSLTTFSGVYGRTPLQNFFLGAPTAAMALVSFFAWATMKRSRTAHEFPMVCMFLVFLCSNIAVCLMHPMVPYETLTVVFATACTVMNLYPRTFFSLWMVVVVLQSYNLALTPEVGPTLYLYRNEHSSVSTRVSDQIIKIVSTCVIFGLVRNQSTEFKALTQVSELGTRTVKAIASSLLDYDTKAARETVRVYCTDEYCDDALAEVMLKIVDNMDAYRPFLPNYILQGHTDDDDDATHAHTTTKRGSQEDEDEKDFSDTEDGFFASTTTMTTRTRSWYRASEEDDAEDDPSDSPSELIPIDSNQHRKSPSPPRSLELFTPVTPFVNTSPAPATDDDDDDDDHAGAETLPGPVHNSNSVTNPLTGPVLISPRNSYNNNNNNVRVTNITKMPSVSTVAVSRRVVIGLVDYYPRLSSIFMMKSTQRHTNPALHHLATSISSSEDNNNETNFIDTLFELADEAISTVHTLFGDTLHVSWNTARRVAQPESRSALFLARVKARLGCVGAAACGPATFQFCGERQLVPLVHASWYEDVQMFLSRYSVPLQANVCDKTIAQNSAHAVRHFMFDALPSKRNALCAVQLASQRSAGQLRGGDNNNNNNISNNNRSCATCVYEILEERSSSNVVSLRQNNIKCDEWMYELEGQAKDDGWCTVVSEVAETALKTGEYSQALELLLLPSNNTATTTTTTLIGMLDRPSVMHLQRRLKDGTFGVKVPR